MDIVPAKTRKKSGSIFVACRKKEVRCINCNNNKKLLKKLEEVPKSRNSEVLKLIVWDIAKFMECFGNRLDKIPDKVKMIPDPTLASKDGLTHLWI